MFSIRRVLFPTDFSACANHALDQAILWCRAYGAELHTLHVLHTDDEAAIPALREQAVGTINELLDVMGGGNLTVHHSVVAGERVTDEIVETIRGQKIDLVIMGTHGRKGVAAILNRSVAEEVVRAAPCPVLVVPECLQQRQATCQRPRSRGAAAAARLGPRRILGVEFAVEEHHARRRQPCGEKHEKTDHAGQYRAHDGKPHGPEIAQGVKN